MAFKYVAFAAVLAVAQAGLLPASPVAYSHAPVAYGHSPVAYSHGPVAYAHAPVAYASPVAKAVVAQPEPYDPNPQYQYGYGVDDHVTGDSKSQQESRNGDTVQGSYSLIDADGFKRTVEYTADPVHGFNAVVHREPLGVKTVTKVASPIAYAAPVAKIAAPVTYAAHGYASPIAKVTAYSAPAYYHH